MEKAVHQVVDSRETIRAVAKQFDICHVTLSRYVKKYREAMNSDTALTCSFEPQYDTNKVFPKQLEQQLFDYLIKASKILYGLTLRQCLVFAYDLAKVNNLKYPKSWDENKCAGYDWLLGFRQRYPRLSLRKPEATSLARATAFNQVTVNEFFTNLDTAYKKLKEMTNCEEIRPNSIYNLDETGLTNVQSTVNVFAQKGEKQVSQATSAERGILVSACCFINALGNSEPPFLVFPRVFFKNFFLNGAPVGTGGCGTKNASGWMNSEAFLRALHHFRDFSRCSKKNPVMLIMDNHESHITIESLNFYKENGIIAVTLPPHTSQKLQPLDKCVFGPLKTKYNIAMTDHLSIHPGRPIAMHEIAAILGKAYDKAFTAENIKSGFSQCGIYPFNRNIFSETDFDSSFVTDRPLVPLQPTQQSETSPEPATHQPIEEQNDPYIEENDSAMPSTSATSQINTSTLSFKFCSSISPEEVRPFQKASPRKGKPGKRTRVKSLVLTSTPVKDELMKQLTTRREKKEVADEKRKQRMSNKLARKRKQVAKNKENDNKISSVQKRLKFGPKKKQAKKNFRKRKPPTSPESESSCSETPSLHDSDDSNENDDAECYFCNGLCFFS